MGIPGLASADYTIRSMGTVRGRIGYAFDQVLLYGTGGYAWSDNRLSTTLLGLSISDSQFHSGWTVGAGVEVMFAPKWSVKAEYLYRSFEGQTYSTGAGRRLRRNDQSQQRPGRRELSLLRNFLLKLPAPPFRSNRNGGVLFCGFLRWSC